MLVDNKQRGALMVVDAWVYGTYKVGNFGKALRRAAAKKEAPGEEPIHASTPKAYQCYRAC